MAGSLLSRFQPTEKEHAMSEATSVIEDWVATWHQPDPGVRAHAIAQLWAEDCVYRNTRAEYHGRAGIEEAVTQAHERFVADGAYVFKIARVDTNHDAIRYTWAMVPAAGGDPEAIGTHVALLDSDGRFQNDHQFVDKQFAG
jgi:uncharacterized protein (TIGR02246 family)